MKTQNYLYAINLQQILNIVNNWFIIPVDENGKEINTEFESELNEIADEMISNAEHYKVIKIESDRYNSYVYVHVINKRF